MPTDKPTEHDILRTLPDAELERVPALSKERIKEALEVGRKNRDEAESRSKGTPSLPKILFR